MPLGVTGGGGDERIDMKLQKSEKIREHHLKDV